LIHWFIDEDCLTKRDAALQEKWFQRIQLEAAAFDFRLRFTDYELPKESSSAKEKHLRSDKE